MAIVIEEEKNVSRTAAAVGWPIVVVIIIIAAYYIFFAPPPAVIVPPPTGFQSITPIAQVNFDPASVLSSPNFQALKQYIPEPTSTGPVPVGKSNPFTP